MMTKISTGYILGLVATFTSSILMSGSVQPALLYLVPLTLIPTILVAWGRGNLASMWNGDKKVIKSSTSEDPSGETLSNVGN